jgi:hypothetical protein
MRTLKLVKLLFQPFFSFFLFKLKNKNMVFLPPSTSFRNPKKELSLVHPKQELSLILGLDFGKILI